MDKNNEKQPTPMIQQYLEARKKVSSDTIIMFHLGDFYEMFEEDAQIGSRILGLTLTQRNGIPMAGIPIHSSDSYIQKLLLNGKKVALCDQTGEVSKGNLVKRELSRILTPGTLIEEGHIQADKNNYILCFDIKRGEGMAAWMEVSTGVFGTIASDSPEDFFAFLSSLNIREIVVSEDLEKLFESHFDDNTNLSKKDSKIFIWKNEFHHFARNKVLSKVPDVRFDRNFGELKVKELLGVLSLKGFGIPDDHQVLGVSGALIQYIIEHLCQKPTNVRSIKLYVTKQLLLMDESTVNNLEIFRSTSNKREESLIGIMDRTVTSAGSRLLERYLSIPLLDISEIERRQNYVKILFQEYDICRTIQEYLKNTRDIQRILSRLENRIKSPRELGAIRDTLAIIPDIKKTLSRFEQSAQEMIENIGSFENLYEHLNFALVSELPNEFIDVIKPGFDQELDRLRSLTRENKKWLENFELKEQERTGIRNLKVRYNNVFGYFVEITKSNIGLVPSDYIRKQTMTNAERYYTQELREREREILNADEKSIEREKELFQALVSIVLERKAELNKTAEVLAELDVFIGWAELAKKWNYCCPEIDTGLSIEIEQGRHPVVEQMLKKSNSLDSQFVPNNLNMNSYSEQILLITGPNMAGKSTYIRQSAMIVLMAQIGSWTPAKRCKIGLVDRIFSRIGSSDELSKGRSTFMVEMCETANILNHATNRSLVILDEIGRGTSTYDGLSIAWAVVEFLHKSLPFSDIFEKRNSYDEKFPDNFSQISIENSKKSSQNENCDNLSSNFSEISSQNDINSGNFTQNETCENTSKNDINSGNSSQSDINSETSSRSDTNCETSSQNDINSWNSSKNGMHLEINSESGDSNREKFPDGMLQSVECGPRTLFATHFHELTRLSRFLNRLRNYCVTVKEWKDEIIFMRRIIPGSADRSYGIQVARLAGFPMNVISRAKNILSKLESEGLKLRSSIEKPLILQQKQDKENLSLF